MINDNIESTTSWRKKTRKYIIWQKMLEYKNKYFNILYVQLSNKYVSVPAVKR